MLTLNKANKTSSVISQKNGVFITLEPIDRFDENEYLALAKKAIENYQNHINQVPYADSSKLDLLHAPATAVIVGTGTVGLEAIVYATRILSENSTIIIIQNDVQNPNSLNKLFTETIKGGHNFQFIISPPMDLGNLDLIETFLSDNSHYLSNAQLFIHAADKAKRYVPDALDYREVISQIIRRCSIQAIENLIEQYAKPNLPYVRILFSSVCSIDRSQYRLPNIGPYQLGKIVGDELFKSKNVRDNSYSFILYAGGMFTMGETLTRNEEYRLLKDMNYTNAPSEATYTESWSSQNTHVDSMDSSGLMFKKIWEALNKNLLAPNKIYTIYGTSVPKMLGYKLNVLQPWEPAPYMFDTLETQK